MTDLPIRVLVVEDEPLYAEQLEASLDELGYMSVGPAPNARVALSLHRTEAVDVVLLDIQLRGSIDGVQLASQLLAHRPLPLIFLTSLADKATFAQARLVGPAAYLVKPVNPETLQRAIALAVSNFHALPSPGPAAAEPGPPPGTPPPASLSDALFVKDNGLLEKIRLSEVQCVRVDDKTCLLVLATRSIRVQLSLRELTAYLPPADFVQIQRSYLVNLHHIERLDLVRNLLQVGTQLLPISRTYRDELLQRLRLLK